MMRLNQVDNMIVKILVGMFVFSLLSSFASAEDTTDMSEIISKDKFLTYKDVADFIDDSPKVTIPVKSEPEDIEKYGEGVVRALTGFDCDRDGKMDDNKTCNAVYYKLWMKYKR